MGKKKFNCANVRSLLAQGGVPSCCRPRSVARQGRGALHAHIAKPDYIANTKKDLTPNTAPQHDAPLSRHRLSYLNGRGGSDMTTRAIELFHQRDPLVFTLNRRLAKEMRARAVKAQTHHSFFRWSSQTEWTPERMGQKFFPRVIIWDKVCTVPRATLEIFLCWLEGRCSRPQSPEKCRMIGSASGVCQQTATMMRSFTTEPKILFSRPSKSESACSPIRSSAKKYERRFLFALGGYAL